VLDQPAWAGLKGAAVSTTADPYGVSGTTDTPEPNDADEPEDTGGILTRLRRFTVGVAKTTGTTVVVLLAYHGVLLVGREYVPRLVVEGRRRLATWTG
jgi:hypothetical protein